MNKWKLLWFILVVIASLIVLFVSITQSSTVVVDSFATCKERYSRIVESDPRRCISIDGTVYVEKFDMRYGSDRIEDRLCTLEAKECPDGSFVGRTPPDCEFEKCPGE